MQKRNCFVNDLFFLKNRYGEFSEFLKQFFLHCRKDPMYTGKGEMKKISWLLIAGGEDGPAT
jgi:hypothetical protein